MVYKILILISILQSSIILRSESSIMSFNIKYDGKMETKYSWSNRRNDVLNIINANKPEIFGVQEALVNQIVFLNENLAEYNYVGVGRDDGNELGEFAAIFYNESKYSVLSSTTFWLSENPEIPSTSWGAVTKRIATFAILKNEKLGDTLYVFNTHFDHKSKKSREESAKLILRRIQDLQIEEEKIVLMGDLNCFHISKPIKILKSKFVDSYNKRNKEEKSIGTYNGFNNLKRRIDYIFTNNIVVLSYKTIYTKNDKNDFISDHYPIMITFSNKIEE